MRFFSITLKPKWFSVLTAVCIGAFLMSACDTKAQETNDTLEANTQEADEHEAVELAPTTMPVSETINMTEAFKGFYAFEAAESLSGNLGGLQTSITYTLDALGYAAVSALDGVDSTLNINVFAGDDFILDYELNNIPEDLARARNLKVLFEKTSEGYAVKHMGVREKCLYGAYQTEWTIGSCPDAPKVLPKPVPVPEIVPNTSATETLILQDGIDAFTGYKRLAIPDALSGTYPNDGKAIAAFIMAFDLRKLANTEGISAWAKIRTSSAGETTWQYELSYLPDDFVYALDYKIYLEKVSEGTQIARIGHRVKCYRGDTPKQWTVDLCP